ncbi:MAG: TetR/AcrR family transcriptional regulator [Acidimicrobiia bacterium]|nr:TetR/AcrR family transcriptional regulator [Actinomycetota bacterium]NDE57888.1 TetR/AcrR family transcriptional regulator [Acidimicrobiia bacterium]NDE79412.1 TetR/AcrR family transcriptional regulator [Actinomycetota bacterium]NDF31329.1 TetR/AcrR family transcriptional regulator [Acidimicrobiia bacterium]
MAVHPSTLPPVPPSADTQQRDVPIDGRRERGARNKAAVVQALLHLYESGEIQPSAARIAEVAGVSERSVFRYFDDMEDLAATAIAIQWERVHQFYEGLDASGNFEERLEAMIDHRLRLFDKTIGVGRASAVASARSATVTSAMNHRRAILREQAIAQFAPEIAKNKNADTVSRIIDYTLSIENIEYLRTSVGLSRPRTRETLATAIRLALA